MKEDHKERKNVTAKRRTQFFALILCIVLGVIPAMEVMADVVYTTPPGTSIEDFYKKTTRSGDKVRPGEKLTWDAKRANGAMLVVEYQTVDKTVSGNVVSEADYDEGKRSSVQIENCGIADLDYWLVSDDFGFEPGDNEPDRLITYLTPVEKEEVKVTVNVSPDDVGTAKATKEDGSAADTAKKGDLIKLVAQPADKFVKWTTNNTNIDKKDFDKASASFTVKDLSEDIVITANFKSPDPKPDPTPAPTPDPTPKPDPTPDPTPKPDEDDDDDEDEVRPAPINPNAIGAFYYKNGMLQTNVQIGKQEQSLLATAIFKAAIPPGWNAAFSMSMSVNGKNEYAKKDGNIVLYIPREYQKPGRTFMILAMDKNGKVFERKDTDSNPNVITFNPNIEGYAYYLIYKD